MEPTINNSKTQIMNNAVGLIKEKGYDKVSIVDICKASDITRTTFYYYFQGKEDIIEDYFIEKMDTQESLFSKLITFDNDLDRYLALCDMLLDAFMGEGPEFAGQLLHSILNSNRILASYFIKDEWCVPLLTNSQKNGLIRNDLTPEELDQLCVHQVIGLCLRWCSTKGEFDLRKAVHQNLQAILKYE